MIDLSVLICSTNSRYKTFGRAIQDQIWPQYDALDPDDQARVEILLLTDNKQMMLGHKRNVMVDMAQGRYVQFVDDDDRIEPDLLKSVLDATQTNADVITFLVAVSLNGGRPKLCRYSKDFLEDRNTVRGYERLPNHICVVKRDLARKVSFPNVLYGEDSGYSKLLHPLLKSQHVIDRVLYHYDYSIETTETQIHLRNESKARTDTKPVADIIILSNGSTLQLRKSTQKTVDSCIAGANSLPINVMVLEQHRNVTYRGAKTVPMTDDFNYNRYVNRGASLGQADWIVVCNNDLIFHDGWLHALLAAKHPLVSPKCPRDSRQKDITTNTEGDITGRHLSGWCYMISRKLWKKIGGFDEAVSFWCSDDVVIEQLRPLKIKPMLVPASVVEHDQSRTIKSSPAKDELTWAQLHIFIEKYGSHRLENHPEYVRWRDDHSS